MAQNPEPQLNVTALASIETRLARPAMGLPTPQEIKVIEYLGQTYMESGLAPAGVKNWQAAVIAIQAGRELGIPPTVAIREIYVVKGQPSCSSQLMMALVRAAYGPSAMRVKDNTATECTVEYRVPGWDGTSSVTFTIDDAKKAGLLSNNTWSQYPRAMLRNRAISEAARSGFPDAILGMYTPEEMGAPVDEEGRIVVTGTVIDHDTGEVTVHRPQSQQNRPPREIDPDRAMKALHAVARDAGITHEQLHGFAVNRGRNSLNDVSADALDTMAQLIRNDPEKQREYFAQFTPIPYEPGDDDDVPADADTQAELINDPELIASADAVAARYRQ